MLRFGNLPKSLFNTNPCRQLRFIRGSHTADLSDKDRYLNGSDIGLLSRSGNRSLRIQLAEKTIPDDQDGYDKIEFDIVPRKNAYYYKYEIPKYARQGAIGLKRALELFREMKSEAKLEPDVNAFSPLIYGCAKAGYTKRAFDLYEESLRYLKKPTNSMITCLINACAESPFPEYGLERLNWFLTHIKVESNRQLGEIHYNCAIKAYGKLGQLNKASELVQEMLDNNVMPTIDTFNMLLIGCASNQESGSAIALRVFKRLKMYEYKPTVVTYRLLLRCIRNCGMGSAELIEEILKELPAITSLEQRLKYKKRIEKVDSRKRTASNFAWTPLISDLGRSIETAISKPSAKSDKELVQDNNDHSQMSSHQDKSLSLRVESDDRLVPTFDLVQQAVPNLLSDDHLDLIYRIKLIRFDKLAYRYQRMTLFGGISGFLKAMIDDKCKPDAKTFSLLLACIWTSRENLLEYHKLAVSMNVERDLSYYDQLIRFVCDHGRFANRHELALHFVEQMHLDNLRPNISTFEALAGCCDTWAQARQLLDDIERSGFAVSPMIIARLLTRARKNMNFSYLNRLIDFCVEVEFRPLKHHIEELENLRIKVNDLILKHEKGKFVEDIRLNENTIANFDKFHSKLKFWLKSVDLAEEDHPWKQFKVDTSSKRDGFRTYTKHFKVMEKLKEEATIRGNTSFGNLSHKAEKILRAQV